MILQLTDVSKSFRQGDQLVDVFKNINLSLAQGETLAILGASGSGKSTLLSLIAGLDAPSSGHVIVDEQDLGALDESELTEFRSRKLGIVFQNFHLFYHLSALENIMLPLEIAGDPEAQPKAQSALQMVGLGHRGEHLPSQLSGGENQRVAIARALAVKPRLLLADEPSGSLDARTGEQVMKLLFDLVKQEGMTMVLVTHNEELAGQCKQQFHF